MATKLILDSYIIVWYNIIILFFIIGGCSSFSPIYNNGLEMSPFLYPWLRNGTPKTVPYVPEPYLTPRCKGCKYDPSIWI